MAQHPLVSPHDQRVTFVELFFDLVFVFAVTQTVRLFHHHPGWSGAGEAVLVFWLVWWAWTQFTWALNAADTTHPWIELGALAATAIAFVMAVSLPGAFQDRAVFFALPYAAVRILGLVIYGKVAWVADPGQHAAVKRFTVASGFGLAAVVVGAFLGGAAQLVAWAAAVVLDVIAAVVGGRHDSWNLHPEHFAERHGLIVIIALGESLIVAATGVATGGWTPAVLLTAMLGVGATCALWWSYFTRIKPRLEEAIAARRGAEQSEMARDVFSLIHFPLVGGIIAFAAGLEEALAHAGDPLAPLWRVSIAAGLVLYLGSMALAVRRAEGNWLVARLALCVATAAGVYFLPGPAAVTLGIVFVGVTAVAAMEHGPLRTEAPDSARRPA